MIARWAPTKLVSEVMGVHESTVRRWCRRGLVKAQLTPGGGAWRVQVDADGFAVRA